MTWSTIKLATTGIFPQFVLARVRLTSLLSTLTHVRNFYTIAMPAEKVATKSSETRRSTKPIMEKRRRARINNSLTELKNLILDALKKDNARHSKLEKADILEMTVKHLRNLQRHQITTAVMADPNAIGKYRSGFNECANEVNRYLNQVEGVDTAVKQRLLNHLANCLTSLHSPPQSPTNYPLKPIHVQVPDSPLHTKVFEGVHLLPTRLSTGELAFLVPQSQIDLYNPATVPISPATSTSPVTVLGSGILSPASSDRSSPVSLTLSSPSYESVSPVPNVKVPTNRVWRPW
ncbi:transcription factor HES-4-like [Centruroides sculpturatus]|uniref:transcription factor HES-4-like n=1 Tax=Centruroides sculpturatus TaxID=218467 RepID=UPI000C6EEC49|nr:transcription factor HES-4-like [Centruroides sculpturatus]